MGNFGDVREILQRPATLETWEALIDALDSWYGREPMAHVLSYGEGHLSRWPADVPTFAPHSWFKRSPELIANNPITAFFVNAFLGRTGHWRQWAAAQLDAQKPLKPPAFLSLAALGPLRWRGGQPLDENQKKRFIVYMRSFNQIAPVELERLRQLLNDEDAQRWGKLIHDAWVNNGSPSSHRWAFFQLACLGNQDQIQFDTDSLSSMISQGRHVRAKQLMDMRAALGTREALSDVANFAVFCSLSRVTRHHAVTLLEERAKARGLTIEDYIERRLILQDQAIPQDLEYWQDPLLPFALEGEEDEEDEEEWEEYKQAPTTVAGWLEQMMLVQRAFGWWMLRDELERLSTQPGVLWSVDGGEVVWFDAQGPVNLAGERVEPHDDDLLRVTHPATLSPTLRQQWLDHLAARQLAPPFIQLQRPVFDHHNLVITKDKPLVLRFPSLYRSLRGADSAIFLNGYGINSSCLHIPGALWCALIHDAVDARATPQDELLQLFWTIISIKLISIFELEYEPAATWEADEVAISETHYTLAAMLEHDGVDAPPHPAAI